METIANSAEGTAAAAMVAHPSTGFLDDHFYADGSPTKDTEDCLGRIGRVNQVQISHHVVSPLDMTGVDRHGSYPRPWNQRSTQDISTWDWPYFHDDPQQETPAKWNDGHMVVD